MKRGADVEDGDSVLIVDEKLKRRKSEEEIAADDDDGGGVDEDEMTTGFTNLGQDLLFEVLKHVDARTLAISGCVNKQWNKIAQDERLWEMICTRHWASSGTGNQQLRSVVLALGGFRRLHSLYLWPILKPLSSSSSTTTNTTTTSSSSSSSPSPAPSARPSSFPAAVIPARSKMPTHWGKDEVHLSLSLLSIRFYEKMCPNIGGGSNSR